MEKTEDIEIGLLLDAIFQRYHYDFRGYSRASIKRRLLQARSAMACETFSQLQDRVLHEPVLMQKMLGYLTVQVSELFRDPHYFRAMREKVFPHLQTYPSLKIWIAGCAGGEEVYSFAIMLREEGLESRSMIYATDINADALRQAQEGVYSLDRIRGFTENHRLSGGKSSLSDYYTAGYGAATFDRSLRQRVVFSDHSLVTDEVFAEVQLVSCRNVLIYFDRPLQDRAVGLFHRALDRKGFLGLGTKESLRLTSYAGAFSEFAREERIYQKKEAVL